MSQTLCKALTKRQHAVHEHVYTEGAYVLNVKGNADASQLDLPIRLTMLMQEYVQILSIPYT